MSWQLDGFFSLGDAHVLVGQPCAIDFIIHATPRMAIGK
jgi:hypothetical protein